ncbi:hypothetical protein HNV11_12385 [Spirosoma taeanense]|uniref:Uncharacterized protein n=1 Tax=Spirosoma taeanense TaxID=2735870 RepID=A0A6M5Y6V2_9BACT|nr:hypothetical protein [Spirosoma taeanense]QJW90117.1 hypothetical protein HNV11_12385 [Spirosoma taeanense]
MPICTTPAPEDSVKGFTGWLAKRKPDTRLSKRKNVLPHKVFHVNLSDIIAGKGFTNAHVVSWRHIYSDKHGSTAIETKVGESGDFLFHEAHSGPMVDEMKTLHLKLKKRKKLQSETYEFAFLRMFALKISAIWLRAADRQNDYFVPLPPYFYGLEQGRLYPVSEFIAITQRAITQLSAKSRGPAQRMMGG